jgi:formylglycine-generating enzyme required for sulfatase activity
MKNVDIDWIDIPGGIFMMGSPDTEWERDPDERQHLVTLSSFRISRFPVTFSQYDAFCFASGRPMPDDHGWGRDNRPVISVNWFDACAFSDWLGLRLPTEAEWEYVCRAGSTSRFHTGFDLRLHQANFDGQDSPTNFHGKTLPIGSFPANDWGVYDMHGTVWEWCQDWYAAYETAMVTDPKGSDKGSFRVIRGGSWLNFSGECRSANRDRSAPEFRYDNIGFRLVMER